jgi:hypothetical protein
MRCAKLFGDSLAATVIDTPLQCVSSATTVTDTPLQALQGHRNLQNEQKKPLREPEINIDGWLVGR